jgi:hypothetical protein
VLLASPRSALSELFPHLDLSRLHAKPPRSVQRLTELQTLGLQPLTQWSTPGGRKYALYGRASTDVEPSAE